MKLQSLAAVAALTTCLFAGSAFADGRIAVALESPVAAKTKIVAGGAVFVCDGAECVSTAALVAGPERRGVQGPGQAKSAAWRPSAATPSRWTPTT